jgi:hypothetical protein
MPTKRRAGAIAVALLAVALTACSHGGSTNPEPAAPARESANPAPRPPAPATPAVTPLSKADFVARANQECIALEQRVEALPVPTNPFEAAYYLRQAGGFIRETTDHLKALPAPSGDTRHLKATFTAVDTMLVAVEDLAKAFANTDTSLWVAFESAEARTALASGRADAASRAFGLDECAEKIPQASDTGPADDVLAQVTVREAFTAEKAWYVDHETYTASDRELSTITPELTYIGEASNLGAAGGVVYAEVGPGGSVLYLGAKSGSGRCFWLRDDVSATTFAVTDICAGRPLDTAFSADGWTKPAV